MTLKKTFYRLAAGLFAAFALVSPAFSANYEIPVGWSNDFASLKQQALETHVPLVLYWGNFGCNHCTDMSAALAGPDVVAWVGERPYVFCYNKGTAEENDAKAFEFADKRLSGQGYPYVCVYWKRADGTVVEKSFVARDGRMPKKTGSLGQQFMASVDEALEGFLTDEKLSFPVAGTETDRLEIEAATKWVDVPIAREGTGVSSCSLEVKYPGDDHKRTYAVSWAAGQTHALVRVDLDEKGFVFTAGKTVPLYLYDSKNEKVASSKLYMVADVGNSPTNPYFGHEDHELRFGEWTMDLEAAKGLAAKTEGACTFVFFTGALWCPHCRPLEADVFESEAFRAWTRENKIALALLDNPKRMTVPGMSGVKVDDYANAAKNGHADLAGVPSADDEDAPTLLRRAVGSNGLSGTSYLSRKMIEADAAEAVLLRNHRLGYAGGLFNAPGSFRTGYPTLIALDRDGRIRGRFVRNEGSGEHPYDLAENMARLREFLKLVQAGTADDSYSQTTALTCPAEGATTAALSLQQAERVYRLTDLVRSGRLVVSNETNVSGEKITYTLLRNETIPVYFHGADGSVTETNDYEIAVTLASGVGALSHTVSAGETYYLKVAAYASDRTTRFFGEKDTTIDVTFGSTVSVEPGVIAFEKPSERFLTSDGTATFSLIRTNGLSGTVSAIVRSADAVDSGTRYVWADRTVTFADGESRKAVTFELIENPGAARDATFTVTLEAAGAAAVSSEPLKISVFDTTDPLFVETEHSVTFWKKFGTTERFAVKNVGQGERVVLKKTAGSLPDGVTMTYEDGFAVLSGRPTKNGTYAFSYQVREVRDGKTVKGNTANFKLKVQSSTSSSTGNPHAGTAASGMVVPLFGAEDGLGGLALAGLLDLSVTSANKISAKYRGTEGKTVSFSDYWQRLDDRRSATAVIEKGAATLSLAMDLEGRVSVALALKKNGYSWFAGRGETLTGETALPQTDVFSNFKGYYTVQLPDADATDGQLLTGTGSLRLKMTSSSAVKKGTVTYAGVMPDGTAVSGSAALAPVAASKVSLPVFCIGDESVLALMLDVKRGVKTAWKHADDSSYQRLVRATEGTTPYHLSRQEDCWAEPMPLEAWGGAYDVSTTPKEICSLFGYSKACKLSFDAAHLGVGARGRIVALPSATATATSGGFSLSQVTGEKLTMSVDEAKGTFSGKASVEFYNGTVKTGTFSGVLMPGWIECPDCGEMQEPQRPLGAGTLTFGDKVRDEDGATLAVTRSLPVTLRATLK